MAHHEDDDFKPREIRQPHTTTVDELELSHAAYDEIRVRLEQAGHLHVFMDDGTIDMTGIGLTKGKEEINIERTESGGKYAGYPRPDGSGTIGSDDPIDSAPPHTEWCQDTNHTGSCHRYETIDSNNSLAERLAKRTLDARAKAQQGLAVSDEEFRAECLRRSVRVVSDLNSPIQTLEQRMEEVRSANTRQVGGSHYGGGAIQHWDLAVMFKWNWAQYQITKYVMRYLGKNGLQDLEKAQHFLEKLIEEIKAGRMPEKNL